MRDDGAGEELCTTMDGVGVTSGFFCCERREFRRDRERASVGGGDFKRGEMGQWGVVSPELDPEAIFWGLGARVDSCEAAGDSEGMLVDESAR